MAFKAEVKADSISPDDIRLTTFEATYPRIVHSEMMTHRVFSRNSASTRAIPIATQLLNLLTEPFIPEKFGVNQPGMQAYKHLVGLKHDTAVRLWLRGRDRAVTTVLELILGEEQTRDLLQYEPNREFVAGDIILEDFDNIKKALPKSTDAIDLDETSMLNVHKQLAGRGLEAYMWHTIVLTGTEFGNFFALRDHPEAQGEIATIARYLREASVSSEPNFIDYGGWHLPYVDNGEFATAKEGIESSAARAAAASYGRQNVKNPEREAERYADLRDSGHMSPLEHQATPLDKDEQDFVRQLMAFTLEQASKGKISDLVADERIAASEFSGNYKGWRQHRKFVPSEHNFGALRAV